MIVNLSEPMHCTSLLFREVGSSRTSKPLTTCTKSGSNRLTFKHSLKILTKYWALYDENMPTFTATPHPEKIPLIIWFMKLWDSSMKMSELSSTCSCYIDDISPYTALHGNNKISIINRKFWTIETSTMYPHTLSISIYITWCFNKSGAYIDDISPHTLHNKLFTYYRAKFVIHDRVPTTQRWNHFDLVLMFLSDILVYFIVEMRRWIYCCMKGEMCHCCWNEMPVLTS